MSIFLKDGTWKEGYRTISYVQFGISLIVILSLVLWRKYDKRGAENVRMEAETTEAPQKIPFSKIILLPGVITGIASLGLYCAVEFLMGTWGASYLINARGMSADKASQMVALYYGGIMIGRFISGIVSFLPIRVQSASPVYIWQRVRPWIVSAAIPTSCNR